MPFNRAKPKRTAARLNGSVERYEFRHHKNGGIVIEAEAKVVVTDCATRRSARLAQTGYGKLQLFCQMHRVDQSHWACKSTQHQRAACFHSCFMT